MESNTEENSWKEVSDDKSNNLQIVPENDKPEVMSQNGQVGLIPLITIHLVFCYKRKSNRNNCTSARDAFTVFNKQFFENTVRVHCDEKIALNECHSNLLVNYCQLKQRDLINSVPTLFLFCTLSIPLQAQLNKSYDLTKKAIVI